MKSQKPEFFGFLDLSFLEKYLSFWEITLSLFQKNALSFCGELDEYTKYYCKSFERGKKCPKGQLILISLAFYDNNFTIYVGSEFFKIFGPTIGSL